MLINKFKLKKIKGDASFRLFYRKKEGKKKSIIVYARREKKKNLLIYDAINRLLVKNKILAPKLYKENYKKNFLEIEDFGKNTVFDLLKKRKSNKKKLYKKSINLLNNIQKIKASKTKNFKGKIYKLPFYDSRKLTLEARLFTNWYAKKFISENKFLKFNIELNKQIKFLLSNIKSKDKIFVHRDFHVSNLMIHKSQMAIIDSQDALIGNKAYDLASLIDDVRFKTNIKLKNDIYNYYLKLNKDHINKKIFLNDFQILSVLRNMKVIGIFTRLAMRDKKREYLNLIPYAWKLIELRINENEKLTELKSLFDNNFSKKMRSFK
jgi:N-acetylmuramate 1-kinase